MLCAGFGMAIVARYSTARSICSTAHAAAKKVVAGVGFYQRCAGATQAACQLEVCLLVRRGLAILNGGSDCGAADLVCGVHRVPFVSGGRLRSPPGLVQSACRCGDQSGSGQPLMRIFHVTWAPVNKNFKARAFISCLWDGQPWGRCHFAMRGLGVSIDKNIATWKMATVDGTCNPISGRPKRNDGAKAIVSRRVAGVSQAGVLVSGMRPEKGSNHREKQMDAWYRWMTFPMVLGKGLLHRDNDFMRLPPPAIAGF